MYYEREVKNQVKKLAAGFPVIAITGPRQSGKTTFIRHNYSQYKYFNLENPDTRQLIASDPVQFLAQNPKHIIIDEVQRLPDFLSYLQDHVDRQAAMGEIIISGSQNLLLSQSVSQTLAGRAAYQTILPFSLSELRLHNLATANLLSQILRGFYPSLYVRDIAPGLFYQQYISTYVERDARLIRNIQDLSQFQIFIQLVAGRVGQVINLSSLANDTGISPNTAEDWLSLLEASYIIRRLTPFHKNIGKRLIKSPKIYFYDTGLLCALLNLSSERELSQHYARGSIFENLIVSELLKNIIHQNISTKLYFFRDSAGNEIDLILDTGVKQIPVEIKSSATFSPSFLTGLKFWRKHIDPKSGGYIIYGGEQSQKIQQDRLLSWKNIDELIIGKSGYEG